MTPEDAYLTPLLAEAHRVLGLVDREIESPSYGCCDREYWAWKFVDFPRSRFQEAICYLSFLYSSERSGERYRGNDRLLEWILGAVRYWSTLQHRDGSFDEAYPFERSYAATAFTACYVSEGLSFLGDACPPEERARAVRTIDAAAGWLVRNDETHGVLSNHLAAGAATLLHAWRLTGSERYRQRAWFYLNRILDKQSTEGWYEEYGGADPGYQTHGSFYLVRCWQMDPRDELRESLRRGMAFLAHWVQPDGSFSGEYASRNTQTYYPAAFEMFAAEDDASAWIALRMRPSVTEGRAVGLHAIDAFNYFPLLNNLVFASVAAARAEVTPQREEWGEAGLVWFPEAGMARVSRDGYVAYVGTSKGGVVKVFDRARRRLAFSDCGYVGRLTSGEFVSSHYLDRRRLVEVADEAIAVEGTLSTYKRPTMKPWSFAGFRFFTLTVGRVGAVAKWLKAVLVNVLIYRRASLPVRVRRAIEFLPDGIRVRDRLEGDGSRIARLSRMGVFTTVHMGSSRYFAANDLDYDAPPPDPVDVAELERGLDVEHRVRVG